MNQDTLGWIFVLLILILAGLCGYFIFSSSVEREPYSGVPHSAPV